MEKRAKVYYNDALAGFLVKTDNKYMFKYSSEYLTAGKYPAISLSFPKTNSEYTSSELFPFFLGLLAEGDEKEIQCRLLGIDENDHFTRLIKTAHYPIGAVSVVEEV